MYIFFLKNLQNFVETRRRQLANIPLVSSDDLARENDNVDRVEINMQIHVCVRKRET